MDVSGWSSAPARGPQDGPNVHHGLSLMSQSLIVVFNLGSRMKQFLCCMYLVFLRKSEVTDCLIAVF
jgi:hypothetical protein